MDPVLLDRQRVYLVCRAIFSGSNAQIKPGKELRKLLRQNKASLETLTRDIGQAKLHEIVRCLCGAGVFESKARAQAEFPQLQQAISNCAIQSESLETTVAGSNEAVAEVLDLSAGGDCLDENEAAQAMATSGELDLVKTEAPSDQSPGVRPLYFLYETQHLILTTTQRVLEECCFDFANKWFPDVTQASGWDCSLAVELTTWPSIFKHRLPRLPCDALSIPYPAFQQVFDPLPELRHTAVHRLRVTARRVSLFVGSALGLTKALRDTARSTQLEKLKTEVEGMVTTLEINNAALDASSASELADIARQRKELDKMEQNTISQRVEEEREYRDLICNILSKSVNRLFLEQKMLSKE